MNIQNNTGYIVQGKIRAAERAYLDLFLILELADSSLCKIEVF